MRDEFVTLRTVTWVHEAHLIKSVLDAEGIEVLIPDEHTLGVNPLLSNALGGARVLVRADDLDRATAALNAFDSNCTDDA
jgi:Putative prokaryotic signal transducing protein